MKSRAILLCTSLMMTACGSSQSDRTTTAIATPHATMTSAADLGPIRSNNVVRQPAATVPPRSHALVVAAKSPTAAAIAPQGAASEAARAAGAEPRGVNSPKMSGVSASDLMVSASPNARPAAAGGVMAAPSFAAVATSARVGDALPPGVPYASDTDPVRIVSYVLSSTVIHRGDDITGDVVTSSNAASVTARVGTFSVAVPKVAQGKFHLHMTMPSVPLPPGDAKLIITAIRTDGKSTTREVAITVAL